MPVTQKEAITLLDVMVEMARDNEGRMFTKRYFRTNLNIMVSDDNDRVQYFWGLDEVDRRVALHAVRTNEEASR